MALSVLTFALIGTVFTIANPVVLAHALNPQPLPPGIILQFHPKHAVTPPVTPPGVTLHFEPPDPCIHTSACQFSAAHSTNQPPDPCMRVALCNILSDLKGHQPHHIT